MSAVTTDLSPDRISLSDLREAFKGDLLGPDDRAYDTHRRIWNGSIDRYPALIARCGGVADVRAAVAYAR